MNGSHDSSTSVGRPPSPWRARIGPIALPASHLLALWAFAAAQPLYDILQRNGEFFIAHRTQPIDLVLFTGLISVGLPLLLVVPWAVLAWFWPRAGRVTLIGLVGLLAAALVSQILAHRVLLSTPVHFAIAGALGVALAWVYATRAAVRTFMTMLSPSVLAFPVIFLLHPSMSMFVWSDDQSARAAADITGPAPPMVFMVFDQLPVTSLMNGRGQIDRDRYPGFAALADHATWYRNASTVADFTGWAVPPILSGQMPSSTRVPTTRSYPGNLFTWLGARYRFEVQEPITQLCPERLCSGSRPPLPVRMASMALDSSVVYLTVALPAGLRTLLPPLTENWKDFINDQRWQRRWVAASKEDRREVPRDLIASISRDDPQPTLYYAHTLLPHEPYVYLRSGQEFTTVPRMIGTNRVGRWTSDPWPATLGYQRHLQQLEYVDAIVAAVIDRLKAEGLYDKALIVVTSDHGVSFRPGFPHKGLDKENLSDVMSVPLLIKAPDQRQGRIDDGNMQAIDVMPTIASLLKIPLTWTPDGRAGGGATSWKSIRHGGATMLTTVEAAVLAEKRDAAVARKIAIFGESPGWRAAATTRRELIGQPVSALDVTEGPWQATIEDATQLLTVDLSGPSVPAVLRGRVRDGRGAPVDADVAVALNGVVTAVASTYRGTEAVRGSWAAMVNPALLVNGRNDVRVYVVPPSDRRLHLAYSSRASGRLNLASRGAHDFWAVAQSGFFPREGTPIPHRWTTGEGVLVVPLEAEQVVRSLRIGITGVRPGGSTVTVTLNECTLFAGRIDSAPWYRTFPLRACPASALAQPSATIVVKSPPWVDPADKRTRGVAVETVNLFEDDWPVEPSADQKARASITPVGGQPATQVEGTPLSIVVANLGTSTWLSAIDAPAKAPQVQLALRWQSAHASAPTHEQHMDLPHAVYPTDRLLIEVPMVPPDAVRQAGPWKVTITPVTSSGTPIPVDPGVVVDVTAAAR